MPRVKPGERRRAYRPKTRTGCGTCKFVPLPNSQKEREMPIANHVAADVGLA